MTGCVSPGYFTSLRGLGRATGFSHSWLDPGIQSMPALPEHPPGMLLKADTAAVAHWSSALNDPDWQSAAGAPCRQSPGKRRVKIKPDCSLAGVEILQSCLGWLALRQNFPSFCREIVVMIRKDSFLGFLASQSRFVYHNGVGVIVRGGENWERWTFCLHEFIYPSNIKSVSFLNKVSLLANRMKWTFCCGF